jgi:hypothetical protein
MQKARHRLLKRHRLYPVEQVGLAESGGVLLGCPFASIDEDCMNLLPKRQFPARHCCIPRTVDSAQKPPLVA